MPGAARTSFGLTRESWGRPGHWPWLQDSARRSANPPALTRKSLQDAADLPALTRMSESRATCAECRQEILNGGARSAAPRGNRATAAGILGGAARNAGERTKHTGPFAKSRTGRRIRLTVPANLEEGLGLLNATGSIQNDPGTNWNPAQPSLSPLSLSPGAATICNVLLAWQLRRFGSRGAVSPGGSLDIRYPPAPSMEFSSNDGSSRPDLAGDRLPGGSTGGTLETPCEWGDLLVLDWIASGAFADVYLAREKALDRPVALENLRTQPCVGAIGFTRSVISAGLGLCQ
jgi:hypothetical protein